MSCSNAGCPKGRGSVDQLFIIYGLINDVINGDSCSINLMSMDVSLCFDKLDFSETNNDLWDVKVTNDKFALLSKLDERCVAKIKTPCGETNTLAFADLTMQGSVNSSMKCSVQIDTLGRQLLSDGDGFGIFQYKRIVDIPPISFCDDIMSASECGIKYVEVKLQ